MTGPVRVGIVLGSDSDLEVMLEAVKVLDALEVGSEVVVTSAHRTPQRTHEYATTAHARGLGVLIAGAGGAAALPGVLAASSPLPVIGVPVASTPLGGIDALRKPRHGISKRIVAANFLSQFFPEPDVNQFDERIRVRPL